MLVMLKFSESSCRRKIFNIVMATNQSEFLKRSRRFARRFPGRFTSKILLEKRPKSKLGLQRTTARQQLVTDPIRFFLDLEHLQRIFVSLTLRRILNAECQIQLCQCILKARKKSGCPSMTPEIGGGRIRPIKNPITSLHVLYILH